MRLFACCTKAEPQITNFAVYNIKGVSLEPEERNDLDGFYDGIARKNGTNKKEEPGIEVGKWDNNSFSNTEWKEMSFDLTKYVTEIGQYEVTFAAQAEDKESGLEFKDWEMEMYGWKTKSAIELLKESSIFRVTLPTSSANIPCSYGVLAGVFSTTSSSWTLPSASRARYRSRFPSIVNVWYKGAPDTSTAAAYGSFL